jgi:hypothetical protein
VLAAFIWERDHNSLITQFSASVSTEYPQSLALHLEQVMFRLVADIDLRYIRNLYWQKQQRHAPCGILKMTVKGASTVVGLPSFVIKASHGSSHA